MNYARMMEATTVGFMVGAFFLNRGHFDLCYHWLALVAALNISASAALHKAPVAANASGTSSSTGKNVVVSMPGMHQPKRETLAIAGGGSVPSKAIVWQNHKRQN